MFKVVINISWGASFCLTDQAFARYKELGGRAECQDNFNIGAAESGEGLPRHEPALVQVVEEMGDSAVYEDPGQVDASDPDLLVVEVERLYRICEYDGTEWVETPESIKWIDSSRSE